ncbi:MAG: mechanosensitive ion channel family protein [Bernardetiaceae bacterium]
MLKQLEKIFDNFDFTVLLVVVLIFLAAMLLSRLSRFLIARYLRKLKSEGDHSFDEATRLQFLRNALNLLIYTVAGLSITYTVPPLRSIAVTLFASAGIFAAFIGFASQNAFANIISGIFIVWFKPFRMGDMIQVGTHLGTVEDITLRHTVIRNPESRRVIIPNSIISKETILNSTITEAEVCRFVEVRVSYDTDLDQAIEILRQQAASHPDCLDRRSETDIAEGTPKVVVRVMDLGETGVLLRAYAWAADSGKAFCLGMDMNYRIKQAFDAAGITWAYPRRVLLNDFEKPPAPHPGNAQSFQD